MAKKKVHDVEPQQFAASIEPVGIENYMIDAYHQYKCYIVAGRVCCNYLDGFLNVYKRALYAAYKECRTHFIKSATLEGVVIGKYNPHGEAYSSICKLVNYGFLAKGSSFENNMGTVRIEASAKRYTEVMLSPVSEILFLNSELLPYVDYVETELSTVDNKYYEPLFLPALTPGVYTAVVETSEFESYMALKAKPVYPRYAVLSLLDYIMHYLKIGIFDPKLLYYQYHNMILRCNENDADSKFSATFSAPTEMDENGDIHIKATLPFVQMQNALKNIPFEDRTGTLTDIVVPGKYYDSSKFIKTVNFNTKAFKLLDTDYTNVIMCDYPVQYAVKILLHNLRDLIFPRYFKDKIDKCNALIKEYQLLLEVRHKYVDLHIPYENMSKDEQAIAAKHKVNTFLTIEKKIEQLQNELKVYEERSKDIPGEILKLYEDAYKKVKKYLDEYFEENGIVLYDITPQE